MSAFSGRRLHPGPVRAPDRLQEFKGSIRRRDEQVGSASTRMPRSVAFTLWDNQGSVVIKGDLLVVPIEDSILYIQPIFLEAEGGGIPEFRRVIVVYRDQVEWSETLDGALEQVFGDGTGRPSRGNRQSQLRMGARSRSC